MQRNWVQFSSGSILSFWVIMDLLIKISDHLGFQFISGNSGCSDKISDSSIIFLILFNKKYLGNSVYIFRILIYL